MADKPSFESSLLTFIKPETPTGYEGKVAYQHDGGGKKFLLTNISDTTILLGDNSQGGTSLTLQSSDGTQILRSDYPLNATSRSLFTVGHGHKQNIEITAKEPITIELKPGSEIFQPTEYNVTISPQARVYILDQTPANTPENVSKATVTIPIADIPMRREEGIRQFFVLNAKEKMKGSNYTGFETSIGNTQIKFPVFAENDPNNNSEFTVKLYDPKDESKSCTLKFRGGIPVDPQTDQPVFTLQNPKQDLTGKKFPHYEELFLRTLEAQVRAAGMDIKYHYTEEKNHSATPPVKSSDLREVTPGLSGVKNASEPVKPANTLNETINQVATTLRKSFDEAAEAPADATRPQNVAKEKPRDKTPQR